LKSAAHRRAPKITRIPLSKIRFDERYPADDRLTPLVVRAETGVDPVALTRIREDQIVSGFFVRDGKEVVHKSFHDEKRVKDMVAILRGGQRPMLLVYWNIHAPGPWKYVCPDDELMLAAYRAAGIRMIPCQILRPKKTARGVGEIWVRSGARRIMLDSTLPASSAAVATMFGEKKVRFSHLVGKLRKSCDETLPMIEAFHQEGGDGVSYHQMLHATVVRHERTLDSIRYLVGRRRREHAGALTRLAYEAYLNFYLDWLSPEFLGPRIQLLSRIRDAQLNSSEEEAAKRNLKGLEAIREFVPLFESTLEKARLSPLTEQFYRMFYPQFSLMTHQSYSAWSPIPQGRTRPTATMPLPPNSDAGSMPSRRHCWSASATRPAGR
jgi:hypothetical protein